MLILLLLSFWGGVSYSADFDNGINGKSWWDKKKESVSIQQSDATCGAAALVSLLNGYYGYNFTEDEILEEIGIGKNEGATVKQLGDFISGLGLDVKKTAFDFEYDGLFKYWPSPMILNIKRTNDGPSHWVVLRGASLSYGVILSDPIYGNISLSSNDFKEQWYKPEGELKCKGLCGVAIVVHNKPSNIKYYSDPKPYMPFD